MEKTQRGLIQCLLLAGLCSTVQAGFTNGDFSQGGAGWTQQGGVVFSLGTARFEEDAGEAQYLRQGFTIDNNRLSFELQMTGSRGETDTFTAKLNDSVFYTLNNHPTGFESYASAVTVLDPIEYIIYDNGQIKEVYRSRTVCLDVTGLAGPADIEFAVDYDFDMLGLNSVFILDNVQISSPSCTVPAPGALGLGLLGLTLVSYGRRWRG